MEAEIITVTCPPWSHRGGGRADIRSLASSDISTIVRKAFNRRLPVCFLDLSGILCSLLIPEYSGIKRRGKPLPGAEESRHFLH